jgi:hypothetical protein
VSLGLLEGVVGKPMGVRAPPSAPVETYWCSSILGAFFVSTGAPRGLEPARSADRLGRKSPTLRRATAPRRAAVADGVIAEAHAVEPPLRHHRLGGDTPLPHPGSETGMSPVATCRRVPFFRENGPCGSSVVLECIVLPIQVVKKKDGAGWPRPQ